jgi:PAS domain S-box-containing protein
VDAATALLLVEQAPDAMLLLDARGAVRAWNPAARRLLGLAPAAAAGRHLSELIGESAHGLLADGCDLEHHDFIGRRADGTRMHINLSLRVQRNGQGDVDSHVCALRDATAARVAQDRERVHARYRGLFASLPDAIVVVNDSGRIVHANAQAEALFGRVDADLVGEPVECLLPPRLREQHLPQRNSYLFQPGLRPMGRGLELFGMRADGSEFPVEISLGPIELDGRRLVISAIRDISDRKAIEHTLQLKNIELERANLAKDRFLATMSHELRTPLNAILGFTGLMLMRLPGPLTETQERQLTHVQNSGRHLLALINDLLDLARIESGHTDLALEDMDVVAVFDEVAATLRPTAESRGLSLAVDPAGKPLLARADRRALRQVALNLLGNAVKFTQQGGVRVRAEPADREGRAMVALAVTDTGVGIGPEDQARLFQAFVQVGDRRTREQGTGLGLHLSLKLVEQMGGALTLHSEPGIGSTFTLWLPHAG